MRPFRCAGQNNDGNLSPGQALLMDKVVVGGEQKIEGRLRGCREQRAVGKPFPTSCFRRDNSVVAQDAGNSSRRSMVKENEHQ